MISPGAGGNFRRAAFISDVHLGSKHCHAEELATFLGNLRCKRLYLVGDIVDLWWMAARRFCGPVMPAMRVRRRAIHTTADGRRLLVTHGDDYDTQTHFGNMQERFGDWLYYCILTGNILLSRLRRRLGRRYWSLSEFLKRRSNAAECYIARYVQAGLEDARSRGLDGIVCGHIHSAALVVRGGLIYAPATVPWV